METAVISIFIFSTFFLMKTLLLNDLSLEKARGMIREGAIIIDVRTEHEYQTSHLSSAVNVPLNEINYKIDKAVSDNNKFILLHCRSGSRSFMGKRILKRIGYNNVYNLGSFSRAKKVINSV